MKKLSLLCAMALVLAVLGIPQVYGADIPTLIVSIH